MRFRRLLLPVMMLAAAASAGGTLPMDIDFTGLAEIMPLAVEAFGISQRAAQRELKHVRELAARGLAEEPASPVAKYTMDTGAIGKFVFDNWGEFYIDRRFVTDEEMKTVLKIETWCRRYFPAPPLKRPRAQSGKAPGVPVFRGFEDERYQVHDALIARIVAAFNADKAGWCGGSAAQAAKIPDITAALVKSHMIEESGGRGERSVAAWAKDPLQVNVPGDWGDEKTLVGLAKPKRRNEGAVEANVRAAVMYLSRKGFSTSARPAAERPKGFFDGWRTALQRYNGRRDRTDTDRYYSDEYADKIMRRAANPEKFVPIEIKLATKETGK